MSSYYRIQLEDYLKTLDVKVDSVLDIGGSAYPVKNRVKSFEANEYKILDNELERPYKEKWTKPDIVFDLNDYGINNDNLMGYVNHFDLIFCLEVAEYIFDPVNFLHNIYLLLKPKGRVIISLPTIYPVHNLYQNDFLRYTEFGIRKLCENAGLKIDKLIPRYAKNPDLLMAFYSNEQMRPAKEYDKHNCVGFIVECTKK